VKAEIRGNQKDLAGQGESSADQKKNYNSVNRVAALLGRFGLLTREEHLSSFITGPPRRCTDAGIPTSIPQIRKSAVNLRILRGPMLNP
jgi:hypothetical protein